jgi:hypothetical protein
MAWEVDNKVLIFLFHHFGAAALITLHLGCATMYTLIHRMDSNVTRIVDGISQM